MQTPKTSGASRHALRAALTLAALALVGALLPATAFADHGRVHLKDGSVIEGEIVNYDPSAGVTVQMNNGSVIELAKDSVARVEIGVAPPAAETAGVSGSASVAPVNPSAPIVVARPVAPAPAPRLQAPMARRPGIAAPITVGALGLAVVATMAAPVYLTGYTGSDYMSAQELAGLVLFGIGGAMAIAGLAIWLPRRVKARRSFDADNERRAALRLVPTASHRHAGLLLSGTF